VADGRVIDIDPEFLDNMDLDRCYRRPVDPLLIFWIVRLYGSLDNARDVIANYGEATFIKGLTLRVKLYESRFQPPPPPRPRRKFGRARGPDGRLLGKKVS
jgi:hypothetical protein